MHRRDLGLWLEEITVAPDGTANGRPLGDTAFWGAGGVRVLAVSRGDGDLVTSPKADLRLVAGDVLIALGTLEQLAVAQREAGERENRDRETASLAPSGRDPRSRSPA